MARVAAAFLLVLALCAGSASAHKGHMGLSYGKGDSNAVVSEDVQCEQVCHDVCKQVPQKVCNEVPYTATECKKVEVQKTKQVCNRVCTQTTTTTEVVATGKGAPVHYSKGKGLRRLAGADSAAHKKHHHGKIYGKGLAPQVDVQCEDQCQDVPYSTWDTQCAQVTKSRTKCDIVFSQQCDKVCKPVCKKTTTVVTTTTQSVGKGAAVVVPVHKGKGKGYGK